MSEYQVLLDRNRHSYLQYRDAGKTRHFITLHGGAVECIQLTAKDFLRMKVYDKYPPEHFAEICFKSCLPMSRSARVILKGLLGAAGEELDKPQATSFNGGSVGLQEICETNQWEPSKARKFLRKLVEKPGGRWEWSPEEAQKIESMLRECFSNG